MNRLAQKIKEERIKAGLSEKALAQKCGLQVAYILQVESGKKIINEQIADKILKALGTEVTPLSETANQQENIERQKTLVTKASVASKPVEPNAQWKGILQQVIFEVPIYNLNRETPIGSIPHPVLDGKVEGVTGDKLYYIRLESKVFESGRLFAGDDVLVIRGRALSTDGIYHFKLQGKESIGRIQTIDKNRVRLSNDLIKKEVHQNDVEILGRCIKNCFRL